MKNLRTVRGVNDLFSDTLYKHNYIKEIGSGFAINFVMKKLKHQFLNMLICSSNLLVRQAI